MSSDDHSYFNTRLSHEPKRDAIWKEITRYLQKFIPENARILELGAGYCSFINQIQAKEKHALDRSAIIKKYADKDVEIHVTNCTNLRIFSENSFDVVFSSFLYEHLSRAELNIVMRDLRRILRTGGILLTMLPNFKYIARHYFDDYTHKQIFSHISFADYLDSKGFELTKVDGKFIPYSFKSRLPKSAYLMRLYLMLPWSPFAGNMLVIARNREYQKTHAKSRSIKMKKHDELKEPIAPTSILKTSKSSSRKSSSRKNTYSKRSDDQKRRSDREKKAHRSSSRSQDHGKRKTDFQGSEKQKNKPDRKDISRTHRATSTGKSYSHRDSHHRKTNQNQSRDSNSRRHQPKPPKTN